MIVMTQNKSEEKVIGIPRAMSFYNNYPFYYGFFTDLGIKIIVIFIAFIL